MSAALPPVGGNAVLPPVAVRPAARILSARQREVVALGRRLLESEGVDALTMRRLGAELGMRAPSLYKHVASKGELEVLLVEAALVEIGEACHRAVDTPREPDDGSPIEALLATYREYGTAHPAVYRLATSAGFPRAQLQTGLEQWAGEPFFRVTGDPHVAQALWACAHGLLSLEIDDRLMPSDLDQTWRAGAAAFAHAAP